MNKQRINITVQQVSDIWQHENRMFLQFNEPIELKIGDALIIESTGGYGGMLVYDAYIIRKEDDGEKENVS